MHVAKLIKIMLDSSPMYLPQIIYLEMISDSIRWLSWYIKSQTEIYSPWQQTLFARVLLLSLRSASIYCDSICGVGMELYDN